MTLTTSFGLRARLLLLAILPAVAILATVLVVNFLRMRSLMLDFGTEILKDRVRTIAADIERDTVEAVTTARVMAMAAENGFLEDRLKALRFTRDVIDSSPGVVGAYFGYEPDADGLDAEALKAAGSSTDPAAIDLPETTPKTLGDMLAAIPPQAHGAGSSPIGPATGSTRRGSCSSPSSPWMASTTRAVDVASSIPKRSTRPW